MSSLHFGQTLEWLRQIDFDVDQNPSNCRKVDVADTEIARDSTEREQECQP
jgi:hypothetical protein